MSNLRMFRHCKPRFIAYALVGCVSIYLFIIHQSNNRRSVVTSDNIKRTHVLSELRHPHHRSNSSDQVCVHPQLDINNPQLSRHFHSVSPIVCDPEPDWVTIENGTVFITPSSKEKYGDFDCEIKYIVRDGDFDLSLTKPKILKSTSKLKLEHDFFTCTCKTKDNRIYENVHAGIAVNPEVHERMPKIDSGLGLNVLMLGFDSVSHMTYIRKLKKTYEYFTKTLGGFVLNGYNIVGDGTPQALIPIMTGKTELELPRTLKRLSETRYCDIFPMVWKDFQANGYATAYAEDSPHIGTFTYRMNGFNKQPTDHYMRPFSIKAYNDYFKKFRYYCLGSRRRSEIYLDWFKQFNVMYRDKPKFAFGFHSELSHDNSNLVETADLDLQSTLKYLNDAGYLNNTLLILMSDHGARFSKVRATLQGKQEERRPFFGFAFPKWFKNKHPEIIRNMKINANRLSTPFDIYFTFRDILNYDKLAENSISKRGMSLFKEIPKSRSCSHAGIDSHWCACLEWKSLKTNDESVKKAADSLLKHLNKLTDPYRELCAELKILNISKAFYLLPEKNMLKFKRTNDADGFRPDLSDSTNIDSIKYQIWIETYPGNGLFEATLTFNFQKKEFSVLTEDISRINKYGSAPKCIEQQHEEMRKYCYCKKQ